MAEPKRNISDCELAQRGCRASRLKVMLVCGGFFVTLVFAAITWGVTTGERVKAVETTQKALQKDLEGLREDIQSGFDRVMSRLEQ